MESSRHYSLKTERLSDIRGLDRIVRRTPGVGLIQNFADAGIWPPFRMFLNSDKDIKRGKPYIRRMPSLPTKLLLARVTSLFIKIQVLFSAASFVITLQEAFRSNFWRACHHVFPHRYEQLNRLSLFTLPSLTHNYRGRTH